MSDSRKSLFELVVPEEKLHPSFNVIRTTEASVCTRGMLDRIFQDFEDPDGNFVEQFQTTAFDARFFELYLFAYFQRSGYSIDRSNPNPDFLVSNGGITVAVEATTVNPPTSGPVKEHGRKLADVKAEEIRDYASNEMAIRFGSPLFSKLKKKYWEMPHCKGLPFVIAIEAFHEENAQVMSDAALMQYLYGTRPTASWNEDGTLEVGSYPISVHRIADKKIPSAFFKQPDAENISAVIFTNSGTSAKFSRMGYHHGIGCETIDITRYGWAFTPDHDAMDSTYFSYSLDDPPLVESWGQGLTVMHNPRCVHPVPRDFFVDAVQAYIEGELIATEHHSWQPRSSKTEIVNLGDMKMEVQGMFPPWRRPVFISPITRNEFNGLCGVEYDASGTIQQGWFSDASQAFLGVILFVPSDKDWGYVVLGLDPYFRFRAITADSEFPMRELAVQALITKIAEFVRHPQRIFDQD